jgi:peptidyl-prolyl cis-trans isomerase C
VKLIREPLLHFLLIGGVFFLLHGAFSPPKSEETGKTIVVSAAEIEWMQASWRKLWNRSPTAEELDGLIQQFIRETVLYREALALGLDKSDQVIRRRLAQKMEFIAKDLAALAPPTDEELRAYFDKHRDRYQEPALYTFTQVFIDPDRRGDATLEDAEAIKAELIEGGDAIDDPGALGDSFMLASYYPEKDRVEIQKLFGGGFVESLIALSPGQWHGPVLSGYGTHLVYVNHIAEPREAVFAEVREQVEREWTAEKSEKLKDQLYAELLAQYSVVVERPAGDDKVAMLADEQSR